MDSSCKKFDWIKTIKKSYVRHNWHVVRRMSKRS